MSFADLERGGSSPSRGTGRPGAAGGFGGGGARPPAGYQSGYPVSTSTPTGLSPEIEYQQLKNNCDRNVERLSSVVANVGKMVPLLGTKKDSAELRAKFHREADNVRALGAETAQLLGRMAKLPGDAGVQKTRKVQLAKIKGDIEKQLNTFAGFQKTFKQSETKFVATAEESIRHSHVERERQERQEHDEQAALLAAERRETNQRLEQQQVAIDFNDQLIEERHANIMQIETEIQQVNDIFRDLASIVQEQGEMLDTIDNNIESTVVNTKVAAEELGKANQYQKSARSKICCLMVIVVIVGAVIAIPLALTKH